MPQTNLATKYTAPQIATNEVETLSPQRQIDEAILAIREGQRSAFRRIVELTDRTVRLTIIAILPDKARVDDVAQEVYIKIFKHLDDYTIGSSFLAWIKAYARNAALSERKHWLRNQKMIHIDDTNFQEPPVDALKILNVAESDLAVALMELIQVLPNDYKAVIQRFYFQQKSTRDIALEMNRSDASIRVLLHRARAVLIREYKTQNQKNH